jgi:hypothetical protein
MGQVRSVRTGLYCMTGALARSAIGASSSARGRAVTGFAGHLHTMRYVRGA